LKFAVPEQAKKFSRKMFFSGISEADQANFKGPTTFCDSAFRRNMLFGRAKSRSPKAKKT
jgi:hypothetical protein